MTTLGVKVECNLGLFILYPLAFLVIGAFAVEHIAKIVVVAIHLVVDGKDAAENSIVATVEHIACVGTNLVVAREKRGVKFKFSVARAILYLVLICLDNVAFRGDKLYIQHLADACQSVIDATRHICLEPHCLAKIVAAVVKMEKDAFLGQLHAIDNRAHYQRIVSFIGPRSNSAEERKEYK